MRETRFLSCYFQDYVVSYICRSKKAKFIRIPALRRTGFLLPPKQSSLPITAKFVVPTSRALMSRGVLRPDTPRHIYQCEEPYQLKREGTKVATTTTDLPWFQFYANDFLAQTRGLTNEEVGIYSILMAATWLNGPLCLESIRSWVGEGYESVLSRFFKADDNGDLYHPKLEELRHGAIETAQKNRERTKKAIETRWQKDQSLSPIRNGDVTETDTQSHTHIQAQGNSHSQAQGNSHLEAEQTTTQPEQIRSESNADSSSAHPSAQESSVAPEEKLAELDRLWAATPPGDKALRAERRKAALTFRKELEAQRVGQ